MSDESIETAAAYADQVADDPIAPVREFLTANKPLCLGDLAPLTDKFNALLEEELKNKEEIGADDHFNITEKVMAKFMLIDFPHNATAAITLEKMIDQITKKMTAIQTTAGGSDKIKENSAESKAIKEYGSQLQILSALHVLTNPPEPTMINTC
jgi:hypothetical protein